jgi:hypothetical protein
LKEGEDISIRIGGPLVFEIEKSPVCQPIFVSTGAELMTATGRCSFDALIVLGSLCPDANWVRLNKGRESPTGLLVTHYLTRDFVSF